MQVSPEGTGEDIGAFRDVESVEGASIVARDVVKGLPRPSKGGVCTDDLVVFSEYPEDRKILLQKVKPGGVLTSCNRILRDL